MDDELDESRQGGPTKTHLWNVADLTAPQRFAIHEASTRATDHNQFIRGGLLYQANYRAGLRVLDLRNVAGGRLEEIGFFDTVPTSDETGFSGAWGLYPFFPSGNIAISSIDRGLFVVRPRTGTANPPDPTVCRPASDRLCLLRNRYLVTVTWRNQFNGATGRGTSRRASDLSGYFTFGDPANLELMVKVLDFGSEVRLFYGQLTNLEFEIRVLDTATGQVREFSNGPNNCGAIVSLGGSAAASKAAPARLRSHLFDFAKPGRGISTQAGLDGDVRQETGEHETGKCVPARNRLCLGHRRFQVEVDWHNQFDGSRGAGRATALSELTGSFAFQDPGNVELLVKTLEFKEDQVLILWGALSNLEYTLKVTDTLDGEVKTYHNPPGTYCGGLDDDAF